MKPTDRPHPPGQAPTGKADLAEQFRVAVEASSPAFSVDLHAESLRGIRAQRWQNVVTPPPPLRLRRWHTATLAAAAAVLLALAMAALLAGRSRDKVMTKGPQPNPRATTTASLRPSFILSRLTGTATYVEPVKDRIDRAQRAFLSRGADRLHRYCLDQLRIFPSRPHGERPSDPGDGSGAAG